MSSRPGQVAPLDPTSWPIDPTLSAEIASTLTRQPLALMLYGSRARGRNRDDSDVDVLELVRDRPGSYGRNSVNVAAYTPGHLETLARRGSLFVRHLRDEGVILCDPTGTLERIVNLYERPAGYGALKAELAVALCVASASDATAYDTGVVRLTRYATRSALYIYADERNLLVFDTDELSATLGWPALSNLLRRGNMQDLKEMQSLAYELLGAERPLDVPDDLPSMALWAWTKYPMAARLFEAVMAGASEIDYTTLTLPA